MTTRHVVVIGGGYAGLTAALRVSRSHRVTLIDATGTFTERIRLHERVAGLTGRPGTPATSVPLAELVAGRPITTVTARVTALAPGRRTVGTHDGREFTYDSLVYALGSRTDTSRVPGANEHAYTLEHAAELNGRLLDGRGVAVVGGGLTGVEVAAELAEAGGGASPVTLVTGGEPAPGLSAKGRAHVTATLERLGARVRAGTRVTAVHAGGLSTDAGEIAAGAVLWTASFAVPTLAADAGLAVDGRGRALVDAALRSVSHPDVYVVGDAARVEVPGVGELRMACATAMPAGAHAAGAMEEAARGAEPTPFRFRFLGQCVGLGRTDGVIQLVRADDSPYGPVVTGRAAARFNEWVNRYPLFSLRGERRRPGSYRWAKSRASGRTAPGTAAPADARPGS
ncbi:NAD(P)/FAD-dependent oxidoreductase [Streptomyces sp. NPDC048172]|uniref:NAD(P)/FAD-dependent oxidoreductase n=1 Tax=Streptomyces sp. NPDC048172 TaxID=3365505 RepID=UPI003722A715